MDLSEIPLDIPPQGLQPDFNAPNPLYPVILTTVVIATTFTTVFTAARLITKAVVARYNVEDCESSI